MKLKLTRQQFNTLADVVGIMALKLPQDDVEDMLLKAMMQRLHIDLEKRRIEVKKAYGLKWHPERCLAFAAVAKRFELQPTSHAGMVVLKIYHEIFKTYNL
jgi:hypothetical protein